MPAATFSAGAVPVSGANDRWRICATCFVITSTLVLELAAPAAARVVGRA